MRALPLLLGGLGVVSAAALPGPAVAAPPSGAASGSDAATTNFAVMRNGERIGSSTVRLRRSGDETLAEVATHIEVKIAFLTVYRYDQKETERWADGRLLAMTSLTRDNGTIHRVSATRSGDKLLVESDGRTREVDPGLTPYSPWNAALLNERRVLDIEDGRVTPVSVTDRGEERLVLQGRATLAHRYSIRTSFPQDLWYDQQRRLVQVELHGSDGSTIQYRPG